MPQLHAGDSNPAAASDAARSATGARYDAIDALRGLIMMIMAVDHASAYIARQHASEFWAGAMSAYTSAFPFLTRWITHLCAPGFFFLLGAGVYWYAATRSGQGEAAAMRRTVWRGFVIVLLGQFIEAPLLVIETFLKPAAVSLNRITAPPPNDGTFTLFWGFITLTGLGLAMMACGLLLRLRPWTWLLVSALCVVATHTLLPASGQTGPLWLSVLLVPGISHHVVVMYPAIPWLAVAAAGMYFAYWWRRNPQQAGRRVWMVGLALVAVSVALRAARGWGNIRLPRDGSWIEFLNNVKYPPSFVFWTMSVGIDLLLLALLARMPRIVRSAPSPLVVFGQTPLFFYLAHFALLTVLALAFFHEPASLAGAWGMWAVVLAVLYPVCLWYRNFKMSKPRESFWRML